MFWFETPGLKLRVGPSDVPISPRGLRDCPWHGGQCIIANYSFVQRLFPCPTPRIKPPLIGIPWEGIPWRREICMCLYGIISQMSSLTTGLGDRRETPPAALEEANPLESNPLHAFAKVFQVFCSGTNKTLYLRLIKSSHFFSPSRRRR